MTRQPAPYARYSSEDDILYVRLRDLPIARTGETNPWTNVDVAADGSVVAVEFVNVASEGVDLSDVPEREAVERLLRQSGLQSPTEVRGL